MKRTLYVLLAILFLSPPVIAQNIQLGLTKHTNIETDVSTYDYEETFSDVDSAYVVTADATPTEDQISHKIITNYGQAAEVAITMPTPTRRNRCVVCIETVGQEFDIIPASGKNFWLDGSELTADYEIEMDSGTSVLGSCLSFIALRTAAAGAYEWHAFTIVGTHVGQAAD